MTDTKQRGFVGTECNEIRLHKLDDVCSQAKSGNPSAAKPSAETKAKSFTVRSGIEVGK